MIKFILNIFILVLALIPTWVFLLVKNLLNPEGFWQKAFVYGFGIYFLGSLQFVCIFMYIAWLLYSYDKL